MPNPMHAVRSDATPAVAQRTGNLEEEIRQLGLTLETTLVATWQWVLATGEVLYSPQWTVQMGFADGEITTVSQWEALIHPDDRKRMAQVIEDFLSESSPAHSAEYRLRHKDGDYRWILVSASILQDEHGVPVRVLGANIDITDRKVAERNLAEREGQLALCIEYCPVPVAMFDRDMRYLATSRRWRLDYGLEGSLTGRSQYEVFPELPKRWRDVHARAMEGAVESCELDRFERADGSLDWLRWEVRPWFDVHDKIGGIVVFSEVVTERKRAEDEAREARAKLEVAMQAGGIGIWTWHIADDLFEWDERLL